MNVKLHKKKLHSFCFHNDDGKVYNINYTRNKKHFSSKIDYYMNACSNSLIEKLAVNLAVFVCAL